MIFTVQSIQDPDAGSPQNQAWQGVTVNRVSELELQFSLANPYAFFADNLKNLYVLPKHLFANAPPGNWRLSDYNLKPVGSGPYAFVSYEKQADGTISAYHLEAWDDYSGTKPLIQNFDFQFFANDSDLVKSFNAGQINGTGNAAPADLASIKRPYDLFSWRDSSYYAVFFNQSKSLPLQDPAVREALSLATDRNALVANVLGGHGQPEYGPVPDSAPYFVPTVVSTSLDLASETLTAAGWTPGADGFRAKTIQNTSVPLAVNLTVPQIDSLTETAQDLQNAWQAIGVRVNISPASPTDLMSDAVRTATMNRCSSGMSSGRSSDLYAFWDSSERFSPGLNLAIYSNKKVDSLVEAARGNLNDASRAQQFANAESAIVNDTPAIFLYSPDYLYVTDKSVQGINAAFPARSFGPVQGGRKLVSEHRAGTEIGETVRRLTDQKEAC